jgi:hypothetical protein
MCVCVVVVVGNPPIRSSWDSPKVSLASYYTMREK